MNQLLNRLQSEPWTLLVSLPRNDAALARAAIRGGAQGLKVHLNVEHFASGTRFGSFEEEKSNLEAILEAAKGVPVGVVPGGNGVFASSEEFEQLAALGVDFFDAYPFDAPAWTLSQRHLDVMLAAFHGATNDEVGALADIGMTMCEASILSHESYGKPLDALDLARYAALSFELDEVPIIVPSQKKIEPRDLPALRQTGVQGILIGAIVTGRDEASLEAATRAFAGG